MSSLKEIDLTLREVQNLTGALGKIDGVQKGKSEFKFATGDRIKMARTLNRLNEVNEELSKKQQALLSKAFPDGYPQDREMTPDEMEMNQKYIKVWNRVLDENKIPVQIDVLSKEAVVNDKNPVSINIVAALLGTVIADEELKKNDYSKKIVIPELLDADWTLHKTGDELDDEPGNIKDEAVETVA